MRDDLLDQYQIPISFKYVPTDHNPGDLLTRGMTLDQFKKNLDSVVKFYESQEIQLLSRTKKLKEEMFLATDHKLIVDTG